MRETKEAWGREDWYVSKENLKVEVLTADQSKDWGDGEASWDLRMGWTPSWVGAEARRRWMDWVRRERATRRGARSTEGRVMMQKGDWR